MGYNSKYKGEEVEALLDKADSLNIQAVDTTETLDDVETNTYVKYVAQTLTEEQKAQARENIGVSEIGGNVDLDNIGFVSGTGTDSALQKGSDERGCEASGDYSIAGGQLAKATGVSGVALGRGCEASGNYSMALGGIVAALTLSGKAGATTYTTTSEANDAFVGMDIVLNDGIFATKIAKIVSVSGNNVTVDNTLSADQDLSNVRFPIHGCVANGKGSVALGGPLRASGNYALAEGYRTYAKGNYSHSEGYQTISDGGYSHAEGIYTYSSGLASHAEGYYSEAIGNSSHSENGVLLNIYLTGNSGVYTISKGTNFQNFTYVDKLKNNYIIDPSSYNKLANITSVVIGENGYTITITLDTDLGELNDVRYAIGSTFAFGRCSHAENEGIAYGKSSHAGGSSFSVGDYAFSHGYDSVADGETSTVFGTNNYTQNNSEFALGISNHSHTGETPAEQTLFSVGCGDWQTMGMDVRIANQIPLPTPEDGTNALEVMRNGDVWLGDYGEGTKIYDGENKEANIYVKSEVDTKINSKQDKASRNLIINSNFDNGGYLSNNSPWEYIALGSSGTKDSIVTGGYNGYNEANLRYLVYGQPVILEAGKTYTLSCVYLSLNSGVSYLNYNHMLGEINLISYSNVTPGSLGIMLNAANGYQKAHITFTVSQTSERVLAIGNTDASSNINGDLFITCIQLEEGDTATEYRRAEETYVTTSILEDALNKPILEAPYNVAVAGFTGDEVMKHGVIYVSQPDNVGTTITIENFEAPDKDVVEYVWHFQTGTMPTLSLPSYIYWANGELPEIEGNTVYELSITATRHYSTSDYIYKAVLVPFKTI